jgi:predicted N-acetyltransferase YhbS
MIEIKNFVECPEHLPLLAHKVHHQWFTHRAGATEDGMLARMRMGKPDAIPLGLVGMIDGKPAGTVSLLESDLEERKDLRPWLAGLLVFEEFRGKGLAAALVRTLTQKALEMGEREVYLYTRIPQLYEKLGWEIFAKTSSEDPSEVVMRWIAPTEM